MKVIAAPGLQVPREGAPRSYITDKQAVLVEASAYYLRQLATGDLVEVADENPPQEPEAAAVEPAAVTKPHNRKAS